METRKITIVSTKAQQKYVIETAATTLRELKAALDAANIDYEGMTFFEGLTKTEIKVDDSLLPHDVVYKGNTTNELVFMLTLSEKKIKSGSNQREELYAYINEYGLKFEVLRQTGKNFTNVSTNKLLEIVNNHKNKNGQKALNEGTGIATRDGSETSIKNEQPGISLYSLYKALEELLNLLNVESIITLKEMFNIKDIAGGDINKMENHEITTTKSSYSEEEINAMFAEFRNDSEEE
jgi:hypothetical protein